MSHRPRIFGVVGQRFASVFFALLFVGLMTVFPYFWFPPAVVPAINTALTTAATKTATTMTTIETELRALIRQAKEKISDEVPFSAVTKLDLSGCGLTEASLKDEYATLLPNLSILFLSNNKFKTLPSVIGNFPKLQMVAFKSNGLESIHPEALQPQLRWLILTSNNLKEIPDTIGRCTQLQKFMLSGNQLTSLPATLTNCTNLELIRLATNQLAAPPLHVLQLPNLRWVALANNPFLQHHHVPDHLFSQVHVIDGIDESAGEILGQGAGGVTRKLHYDGQDVAVKVYGGSMTSDGLPEDERKISMAASQLNCTALIRVIGECRGTGSLVMEYLDNYATLAGPPSLESCSRDVYDDESLPAQQLSAHEAVHLVTVLLDALQQLHAVNITHGDLYGHNILVQRDDLAAVRLSDFGAAFFYDGAAAYGRLLETIELRAYAVLVEEVAALLNEPVVKPHLVALHEACLKDGATMEQVDVWWKQRQLKEMATAFGVDDAN